MSRRSPVYLLMLALSGCAVVGRPPHEVVLRVDPSVPSAAAPGAAMRVSLSPVTAIGSAGARRYAYVEPSAPREVRSAATLFWEEAPPLMVQHALERGLSARLGSPVLTIQAAPAGERRLVVELDRFEEITGAEASAIVALQTTLVDTRTRNLVASVRYCAAAPVRDAAPSTRSAAFEVALNQIMDEMAADLSGRPRARQADSC